MRVEEESDVNSSEVKPTEKSNEAKKAIKIATDHRNEGFNLMNTRSANSIRASEIDAYQT